MKQKPELLMPAGDLEKAKFAIAFGADAVYAGVPVFALRSKENKINFDNLKELVDYVHEKNKKIYLTINIYAHNSKLKPLTNTIDKMIALKPDAFIVSDPGIIELIIDKCEKNKIPIHLSTQANTTNWASVKFWQRNGVSRIILARELTLKEIAEIRKENPNIELETFIHGSMCMSYSGRCLLSNFMTGRDANQGTCAQNCRWNYKIHESEKEGLLKDITKIKDIQESQRHDKSSDGKKYFLEEKLRPGEFIPIEEDDFGTYFMSSRDLCAVEFIPKLIELKIDSLKVEGRNKSLYYASIVARVYRKLIDDIFEGKKTDIDWAFEELQSTGNRGFMPGFFLGDLQQNSTRYDSNQFLQTHTYVGTIKTSKNEKEYFIEIDVKNRLDKNDELEIISPKENFFVKITNMSLSEEKVTTIHPGQGIGKISITKELYDRLNKYSFLVSRIKGSQKTSKKKS